MGGNCFRGEQSSWLDCADRELELSSQLAGGMVVEPVAFPEVRHLGAWKQREAAIRIKKSVSYMLDHLDEPVQMRVLSQLVGTSISNFYHLFKLATGSSPNDFFIRLRMRRAVELLESGLSVKEVATRVGYGDPFYFSRVFKTVHHLPPSRYRMTRANGLRPEVVSLLPQARGETAECRA